LAWQENLEKRILSRRSCANVQLLFQVLCREASFKVEGPLVMQGVYRSRVIRLHGDIKGKTHVVNGQCLKHYIVGHQFIKRVETIDLLSVEKAIRKKYS
jgi:hypothetical protein